MPKPPMTIDELMASEDPLDAKLLEDLWLTGGDPNYDPDDEDEFWDAEDQDQGDLDCERNA